MHKGLEDLSVRDLAWLAELPRFTSLSNLARSRQTTPANVSKAFARIEASLGVKLLTRSTGGTQLTEEGLELARAAAEAITLLGRAAGGKIDGVRGYGKSLRIASRGFMNVILAPLVVARFDSLFPDLGLSFLDLSPSEKLEAARAEAVDVLVAVEDLSLGRQWACEPVGTMRWGLYARGDHPLVRHGRSVGVDELLPWRILRAAWWDGRAVAGGDDFVPLPPHRKSQGHEVQTASTALAICQDSRYLVYVPCAAAREHVTSGRVAQVQCEQIGAFEQTVYLCVSTDRVDQRVRRQITEVLRHLLTESVPVAASS